MPDSKIEIKVGEVSFFGEGPGEWLSKQLDKVLAKLPDLMKVAAVETKHDGTVGTAQTPGGNSHAKAQGTLAAFLKDKKATSNQVRKYLATATWLHDSQNKNRLTTTDVTSTLSTHNQGRLGNPAQCLIRNAGKGWVVKDGKKEFYVTDEGRSELDA